MSPLVLIAADDLRALVRDAVADALRAAGVVREDAGAEYETIAAFARRIGVSRRTVFALRDRGAVVTIGSGRAVRVDVAASLAALRADRERVDDRVERLARRSASRAARSGT